MEKTPPSQQDEEEKVDWEYLSLMFVVFILGPIAIILGMVAYHLADTTIVDQWEMEGQVTEIYATPNNDIFTIRTLSINSPITVSEVTLTGTDLRIVYDDTAEIPMFYWERQTLNKEVQFYLVPFFSQNIRSTIDRGGELVVKDKEMLEDLITGGGL